MAKKDVKTHAVSYAVRAVAPASHAADPIPKKVSARRQKPAAKGAKKSEAAATTPKPVHTTPDVRAVRDVTDSRLDAILEEVRGVKRMVEQVAMPPTEIDSDLDASVDSLRRLLSELIEQRMESLVKDLVDVRREAASLTGQDGTRIVARLDDVLERLGAVRFEAEPLDVVDPLIHVVVDERQQADVPEGLIVETLRQGYRTARGLVVCKAAVAVNQRP